MTNVEPLNPDDTTVVLVDYPVGFSTLMRSHDLTEHVNNVVGLASTAKQYGAGLVVTNGASSKPSGPLYPELVDAIGDTPVTVRTAATAFNCFLDDGFHAAVERTGRRRLVVGGTATDGCVLQTVLGALREDYEVYVAVDASASTGRETHETAIQRMTMTGVVPVTWWSLAAEFQLDPRFADSPARAS